MIRTLPVTQRLMLCPLLLGMGLAHADITVYADPSAFNAEVTAPGIETFFGVAQDAAGASPMTRRTQLGTLYYYQAEASSSSLLGAGTADENWLTANVATDVITFSHFAQGITAFGGYFFGSDFNGQYQLGTVTLSVTDVAGHTVTQTVSDATTSSFIGFVSDGAQIASVSLYSEQLPSGDSLWPTARQLVLGQSISAVPEPGSALLLALGVVGLLLRPRATPHSPAAVG
ncbi:PEP-CTERM sorting domain-containing protein [Roseateles sp.]|uniref:PEP-CTERM sorting domain-containing protein n=1 Tax=Roseateles sp. TaxID=1971397 RepID=UPI003BA86B9F